jgi:hypothetical protein
MFVVGPAIGYIVGGMFLNIYADFDTLEPGQTIPITPKSPLWVGAWWIGFVLAWLLAWFFAFIIALYPAVLPGAEQYNQVTGIVSLSHPIIN